MLVEFPGGVAGDGRFWIRPGSRKSSGETLWLALMPPQPAVQIRGDGGANYEAVGRIIYACQRAGIAKVGFITEPPVRG